MNINLDRTQSRFHLGSHPNEVLLSLTNGSSMYLHIGDQELKSLYNHFVNMTDGQVVVRNQYASTFVLNAMLRTDVGQVHSTQLVLRSDSIDGFVHMGKTIFGINAYTYVTLLLAGGDDVSINMSYDDYEVLRSHFIPQDNKTSPKAFPTWNTKRPKPLSKSGYPKRFKNQWGQSFVFNGGVRDFADDLRVARFVTHTKNVIGYMNHKDTE